MLNHPSHNKADSCLQWLKGWQSVEVFTRWDLFIFGHADTVRMLDIWSPSAKIWNLLWCQMIILTAKLPIFLSGPSNPPQLTESPNTNTRYWLFPSSAKHIRSMFPLCFLWSALKYLPRNPYNFISLSSRFQMRPFLCRPAPHSSAYQSCYRWRAGSKGWEIFSFSSLENFQ